jgi:hypothetical protein
MPVDAILCVRTTTIEGAEIKTAGYDRAAGGYSAIEPAYVSDRQGAAGGTVQRRFPTQLL